MDPSCKVQSLDPNFTYVCGMLGNPIYILVVSTHKAVLQRTGFILMQLSGALFNDKVLVLQTEHC